MTNLFRNRRKWQLVLLFMVMPLPALAGTLIETYGHFPAAGTPWTIDVSDNGATFDFKAGNMESKSPAPMWKPHPGWFIFVQDSGAWAYDGADIIWVKVVTPKNVSSFTFIQNSKLAGKWGDLPNPPKEVFDHLPPNIQAVIRQKFPEGH